MGPGKPSGPGKSFRARKPGLWIARNFLAGSPPSGGITTYPSDGSFTPAHAINTPQPSLYKLFSLRDIILIESFDLDPYFPFQYININIIIKLNSQFCGWNLCLA